MNRTICTSVIYFRSNLWKKVNTCHLNHTLVTCRKMVLCCKNKINLAYALRKSVFTSVVKVRSGYVSSNLRIKVVRCREKAIPHLEAALFAWICDQANRSRMISGFRIIPKALRPQKPCKTNLPATKQLQLSFSGG